MAPYVKKKLSEIEKTGPTKPTPSEEKSEKPSVLSTSKFSKQNQSSSMEKASDSDVKDFMTDMFKSINKELGENALIDLSKDDSSIVVKRFINTGSRQLDYCISNTNQGGFPEGRITEVCGPTASGKTTLALVAAGNVQRAGGVVVYIDSEQALTAKRAAALGVNINERFAYSPETCTEKVFDLIERTVLRAKNMQKDIPILVVWDSVAAASPKAELEGEYEQNTIGLQARALRKGLRKINQILAGQKVTFVIINHVTVKIGVMYGSPDTTTGGTAIPFWSALRIKVSNPSPIKKSVAGGEEIIGVAVSAQIIKNKMDRAWRKVHFDIMFEEGIAESEHIFDTVREFCDRRKENPVVVDGMTLSVSGAGAWKEFLVTDQDGEVIVSTKFYKSDFKSKVLEDPQSAKYINDLLDACYVIPHNEANHVTQGESDESIERENVSAPELN